MARGKYVKLFLCSSDLHISHKSPPCLQSTGHISYNIRTYTMIKDTSGYQEECYERRLQLFTWNYYVHGVTPYDARTGAISTPIYQSSTFRHPELFHSTGFDYSRSLNPTRLELENTIARLEHARYGLAFASGMSAISCIIKLFRPGDHLIVSKDLYGGTYRLFHDIYEPYGLTFSWIDTDKIEETQAALRPETKAIFIECQNKVFWYQGGWLGRFESCPP